MMGSVSGPIAERSSKSGGPEGLFAGKCTIVNAGCEAREETNAPAAAEPKLVA